MGIRGQAAILGMLLAFMATDAAAQSGPAAKKEIFASLFQDAPQGNAAILVGINQFKDVGNLSFAVHDAVELAHLFVFELKLIPAQECYLLLSGQPVAEPVKQHLEQLKQAGAQISGATRGDIVGTFTDVCARRRDKTNLLICSFSTHGFDQEGDAYIMPSDGRRSELAETAVALKFIERKLEGTQQQRDTNTTAGHRLLLVDACQERVSSERSLSTNGHPSSQAFMQALQTRSGQAKLAACSPGEMSIEDPSLGGVGHGLFTYSFLEALRGGAGPDDKNVVRLEAVSSYVATRVKEQAEGRNRGIQRPFLVGPVDAKALPLAARADDISTVSMALMARSLGSGWTADLRDRLVERLRSIDPANVGDRNLLTVSRDFANGKLQAELFVPFLRERLQASALPSDGQPRFINNRLGMRLAMIPAGEFRMGSAGHDVAARHNERPEHLVRISKPFYIGIHEVTKGEFRKFVEATDYVTEGEQSPRGGDGISKGGNEAEGKEFSWRNLGFVQTDSHPVAGISWRDAAAFCKWLSTTEGEDYRLPTEAEWEYACRAGTTTRYHNGDDSEALASVANLMDASAKAKFSHWTGIAANDGHPFTAPVGRYQSNAFGLHDMHGNVEEWCSDWYLSTYYADATAVDPIGPTNATNAHVYRGGSYVTGPLNCRSGSRNSSIYAVPSTVSIGFRVVLNISR